VSICCVCVFTFCLAFAFSLSLSLSHPHTPSSLTIIITGVMYASPHANTLTYIYVASFDALGQWMEDFVERVGLAPQTLPTFPFLIAGNKVDLVSGEEHRAVNARSAERFCRDRSFGDEMLSHFEVSALDGTNVAELFETAARLAMRNHEVVERPPHHTGLSLKDPEKKQEDSCC
jgi:hypothetical protein